MLTDLILGTAGHIDHGKSSLIHVLTGKETARLPEEKKRGITIELGYSFLELPPFRLGIVDVPGHEKFVRHMLSGATGMDLALLVIAADDSVKVQTREHLDILRMLDLPAGVIAITKSDLSEPEWIELVTEEIRELVKGTFLQNAPIVPVSSRTGHGIDELKLALASAARIAAESNRQLRMTAPFRMAIDRCFAVEGYGTVVTGSVVSGQLKTGDTVEIQPQGLTARIRGLQNHESETDEVHRGQRAAINLGGIHHDQIQRGNEIASPGHLIPSRRFFAEITLLKTAARPLIDRIRVRFHIGTSEMLAVLRLAGCHEIQPGETGLAAVTLTEPAVATWGQPFVIRQESPVFTIGGGRILHPTAPALRRLTEEDVAQLRLLASSEPLERAEAAVWFSKPEEWNPDQLFGTAGIVDTAAAWEALLDTDRATQVRLSASRSVTVHTGQLRQVAESIRRSLSRMHSQNPLRLSHALPTVMASVEHLGPSGILEAALQHLITAKTVERRGNQLSLAGEGPKLTRNERLQFDEMVEQIRVAGMSAPTLSELRKSATRSKESITQLVEIGVGGGDLAMLGTEIVVHQSTIDDVVRKIRLEFPPPRTFTVADLRAFLDTSRKYAVPLCELLDAMGITSRDGDFRVVVAPVPGPVIEAVN